MNTAMLMDFYEMTMANGYFMDENLDKESKVAFDVFYLLQSEQQFHPY